MKNVFIETVRQFPNLSISEIELLWRLGKDLTLDSNVHLESHKLISESAVFMTEGIIREYYCDNSGEEFTVRLIKEQDFLLPSLAKFFINRPTKLQCQTLTPVKGRSWHFDDIIRYAKEHPKLYRIILQRIALEIRKKDTRDLRLNDLTAAERYVTFLDEYPGVVNLIPLKHIASYLGMTPETVSRIRAEMGGNQF